MQVIRRIISKGRLSLIFQPLALTFGRQFAVLHAFELDAIGVEEEHRIVVLIVLVGRIDDANALALEEGLQSVDILPVAQLEGVVVQADIADAVGLAALSGSNPVASLAVGPANGVGIFVGDLEAQEVEQLGVEGLGLRVVADADGNVIDADDLAAASHGLLLIPVATTAGISDCFAY